MTEVIHSKPFIGHQPDMHPDYIRGPSGEEEEEPMRNGIYDIITPSSPPFGELNRKGNSISQPEIGREPVTDIWQDVAEEDHHEEAGRGVYNNAQEGPYHRGSRAGTASVVASTSPGLDGTSLDQFVEDEFQFLDSHGDDSGSIGAEEVEQMPREDVDNYAGSRFSGAVSHLDAPVPPLLPLLPDSTSESQFHELTHWEEPELGSPAFIPAEDFPDAQDDEIADLQPSSIPIPPPPPPLPSIGLPLTINALDTSHETARPDWVSAPIGFAVEQSKLKANTRKIEEADTQGELFMELRNKLNNRLRKIEEDLDKLEKTSGVHPAIIPGPMVGFSEENPYHGGNLSTGVGEDNIANRWEDNTGDNRWEDNTGDNRWEDNTDGNKLDYDTGGDRLDYDTGGNRLDYETGGNRWEDNTDGNEATDLVQEDSAPIYDEFHGSAFQNNQAVESEMIAEGSRISDSGVDVHEHGSSTLIPQHIEDEFESRRDTMDEQEMHRTSEEAADYSSFSAAAAATAPMESNADVYDDGAHLPMTALSVADSNNLKEEQLDSHVEDEVRHVEAKALIGGGSSFGVQPIMSERVDSSKEWTPMMDLNDDDELGDQNKNSYFNPYTDQHLMSDDVDPSKEWTPQMDLKDDEFEDDVPQEIIRRGIHLQRRDHEQRKPSKMYQKKQLRGPQKPTHNPGVFSFSRINRAVKKMFGSISNKQSKNRGPVTDVFQQSEGWDIYPAGQYDGAGENEAVHAVRTEMRPAFAYNAITRELVLLPDHDKILVTADGRRIREMDLKHGRKEAVSELKKDLALEAGKPSGNKKGKAVSRKDSTSRRRPPSLNTKTVRSIHLQRRPESFEEEVGIKGYSSRRNSSPGIENGTVSAPQDSTKRKSSTLSQMLSLKKKSSRSIDVNNTEGVPAGDAHHYYSINSVSSRVAAATS